MKSFIAFIILCAPLIGLAQNTVDNLNYNNTNATITNSGQFFHQPNVGSGYEVPKGGGLNSIYAAMFWFMAEDSTSQIYTSLGGDAITGTDVDQGPYSTNGSYSNADYNKPYMISLCQTEIDAFNLWWECLNGQNPTGCENVTEPSADVLNAIYDWPGNGDTTLGQSFFLAPYFDNDVDGTYNPVEGGDYPIIKGCCATYIIQNDAGVAHSNSNTDPIGIEMHYMFYHFGANDLLYNTTFVDVMAINKGIANYPKFVHSMYIDGDLGNSVDDFVGTDSLKNMLYFYNSDNNDDNKYGTNPPALGVVALERPLSSANLYNLGAPLPQINGFKPNGNGWFDPSGSFTKFPYSGNPNVASEWSELSEGNQANDRRGILSTSYGQFNSGDTALQSYAIIYSRIGNNLENAEHLSVLAAEAQAFYDAGDDGCDAGGFAGIEEPNIVQILLYPNPSEGKFTVSAPDVQLISVNIFDLTGKKVNYSEENHGSSLVIDLDEKISGIYLIQIVTDKGTTTKRIIVE